MPQPNAQLHPLLLPLLRPLLRALLLRLLLLRLASNDNEPLCPVCARSFRPRLLAPFLRFSDRHRSRAFPFLALRSSHSHLRKGASCTTVGSRRQPQQRPQAPRTAAMHRRRSRPRRYDPQYRRCPRHACLSTSARTHASTACGYDAIARDAGACWAAMVTHNMYD